GPRVGPAGRHSVEPGLGATGTGKVRFGRWDRALRPAPARPGKARGPAPLGRVGGRPVPPPAHSLPAVHSRPSRQLAEPLGRDRYAVTTPRPPPEPGTKPGASRASNS